MAKGSEGQTANAVITSLTGSSAYVIEDKVSGSKAYVPLQIEEGTSVEVVSVDGGLITGLPQGKSICDNLVFTVKDNCMGLNITWFIELKGTKNYEQAKHSIKQITESIQYMQDQMSYPHAGKYVKNRDYVFAAIAGAPDKTLPVLNNDEIRTLCKKLKELSGMRQNVKDMSMLLCYIKPGKDCGKARLLKGGPPYNILCCKKSGGYIPYPSMLRELLK